MEDQQKPLDLRRYLDVLVRWWWLIAAVTIAAGLVGFFYTKAIQQTAFTADTTILVQEIAGSTVPGLGNISLSKHLASTYKELVASGDILEKAAAKLGRGLSAEQLRGMARVSTAKGDAPLLRVTVTSSDPQLSIAAANTLSEVFIQSLQTKRLTQLTELQVLAAPQSQLGSQQFREAQFNIMSSMVIWDRSKSASASVTPTVIRIVTLSAVLAGFLSISLLFLLEFLNRTLRSPEQIGEVLDAANIHAPSLGIIYKWKPADVLPAGLVMYRSPQSVYAEMFKQFQTVVQLEVAAHPGKAFLITSAAPGEGKTTVVTNLGIALAQAGRRVILLEADFRRPAFLRLFSQNGRTLDGHGGLERLLLGHQRAEEELVEVGIPGLKVVVARGEGEAPNTPHLLGSDRMTQIIQELKDNCDYLLIDSPPILPVADPIILASKADGVILAIALGHANLNNFSSAVELVQRTGTPVLGWVVNKLPRKKLGYGRYNYHYYRYSEYHTRQREDGASAASTNGAQPEPRPARWRSLWRQLASRR